MDEKRAEGLLKKYSTSEAAFKSILNHSKKVQKIALKIAKGIPGADLEFIKTAALLHDIGRFRCPPGKKGIKHGIEGGKILRKEGFPKHARAAERHIGAGITKEDIIKQKLDLPLKDYVPKTVEEKIIAHADNLTNRDKKESFKKVVERYKKEIGEEYSKRVVELKKEIDQLSKNGEHS